MNLGSPARGGKSPVEKLEAYLNAKLLEITGSDKLMVKKDTAGATTPSFAIYEQEEGAAGFDKIHINPGLAQELGEQLGAIFTESDMQVTVRPNDNRIQIAFSAFRVPAALKEAQEKDGRLFKQATEVKTL